MPKPKLNYRGLSNRVRYVMKTRQNNDMTDCIVAIYTKKMKLSYHDLSD